MNKKKTPILFLEVYYIYPFEFDNKIMIEYTGVLSVAVLHTLHILLLVVGR